MNIKAPRFLNDVYRDLRDRRLLLPALALIVALIAVPVLLKKPAEPAPQAPVTAPSTDTSAVTSAVLVDANVPVRQYQKRLAKLKSKNPFTQHFGIKTSGGGAGGGAGDTATGAPSGSSPAPTDTSTAPPADTTSTPPASGGPTSTPPDTTAPDTSGGSTEPTPQPEIRFFAGRVDVTVGPLGKGKDIDNVKYLTFLPDDSSPIAAFVGLTGSGRSESAVFAITSNSAVLDGDGTCAPHKPDPCQFLTLKPGEQRYIRYNDKTYRLKVRDTHVVEVKDPNAASNQGDNSVTDGTNDGNGNGNGGTGGDQPQG